MIPSSEWLLRAGALSALVAIGAWALEEALRGWSKPTRFVWVGGLVLSVALPLLAVLAPGLWPDALQRANTAVPVSTLELLLRAAVPASSAAPARTGISYRDLLLPAWILISGLCALRWAYGFWRIRRARAGWHSAHVGELPVYISEKLGPAVVGLQSPRVVLPSWLLTTDAERLALIVRHETEHARAGDQWLLALAPIAVVLFPWSPALWWQLKRLRLAVELDCDARVLRCGVPALAYGSVLLDVAGGTLPLHPTLAALAEPKSFLERRIRAMTPVQYRHVLLRAGAFVTVTMTALLGAALTGAPVSQLSAQQPPPPPPPPPAARSARLLPPPPPPPPPAADQQQQGTDPIFVVDGVIQSQRGKLDAPSANLRAGTIEYLKPEQATRRFGAKGRYGAVVITTSSEFEELSSSVDRAEKQLPALRSTLRDYDKLDLSKLEAEKKYFDKLELAKFDKMAWPKIQRDEFDKLQWDKLERDALFKAEWDKAVKDKIEKVEWDKLDRDKLDKVEWEKFDKLNREKLEKYDGMKSEFFEKLSKAQSQETPLIIIDGVVYQDGSALLKRLDPNLIDRVEVLKGQAAINEFGERARTGVILIFTKR